MFNTVTGSRHEVAVRNVTESLAAARALDSAGFPTQLVGSWIQLVGSAEGPDIQ